MQTTDPLSYPDFRLEVVRGLLKLDLIDCEQACKTGNLRFTDRHFPKKAEQHQCHFCAMTKIKSEVVMNVIFVRLHCV